MRTIPVAVRPNKVSARDFARPPADDRSFGAFLNALPDVLVARDFRAVVSAIATAARRERGVVIMLGGHIVKTGLAPVLVELMRRRIPAGMLSIGRDLIGNHILLGTDAPYTGKVYLWVHDLPGDVEETDPAALGFIADSVSDFLGSMRATP